MNKYFDNSSTSYPKPIEVADAIYNHITNIGGNYGRATYQRALKNNTIVEGARDAIAELIGAKNGDHVFWCQSATMASNIILNSLDLQGKRVLVSPLEHNAVMRPLEHIGASWTTLPSLSDGTIDIEKLKEISLEDVDLIIINLVSNVNGVIQPLKEVAQWAGETPIMVDSSQALGNINIDVTKENINYLIFTTHKGLFGVPGLGGYYVKDTKNIRPFVYGGTGSSSESYLMPTTYPDRQEAGTPNIVGIVGLDAALKHKPKSEHTKEDTLALIQGVKDIDGIKVFCANNPLYQGDLFSFTHHSINGSEFMYRLQSVYGIECRYGHHCAPLAHKSIGSFNTGTVRISLSPYHTKEDIVYLLNAIKEISNETHSI
ncbi:MAG: aminotransferase class V-fold PLP-dependent enzyme [Rikenellaceae bacterium]